MQGAALQTGTVIYLSPLVYERHRDPEGVLRHELTHSLLFQQMPLRRTFSLVALNWFEEGLAVHYGNPGDYLIPFVLIPCAYKPSRFHAEPRRE